MSEEIIAVINCFSSLFLIFYKGIKEFLKNLRSSLQGNMVCANTVCYSVMIAFVRYFLFSSRRSDRTRVTRL